MTAKLKPRKPRHGTFERAIFSFEVPGETILALHNALSFTMAHHNQFSQESDGCQHCFEAIYAMRSQLQKLIDYAPEYQKFFGKPLN